MGIFKMPSVLAVVMLLGCGDSDKKLTNPADSPYDL